MPIIMAKIKRLVIQNIGNMWGKWILSWLCMGMKNGTTTLENCQFHKNLWYTFHKQIISILGICSRNRNIYPNTELIWMSISIVFVIAKTGNHTNVHQQVNVLHKIWYIHIIKNVWTISKKKKKLLIYAPWYLIIKIVKLVEEIR